MDLEDLIQRIRGDASDFNKVMDQVEKRVRDMEEGTKRASREDLRAIREAQKAAERFNLTPNLLPYQQRTQQIAEAEKVHRNLKQIEDGLKMVRLAEFRSAETAKTAATEKLAATEAQIRSVRRLLTLVKEPSLAGVTPGGGLTEHFGPGGRRTAADKAADEMRGLLASGGGGGGGGGGMGFMRSVAASAAGFALIELPIQAFSAALRITISLMDAAYDAATKLASILYALGSTVVKLGMEFESNRLMFQVLAGGAEQGDKLFASLQRLALGTPYTTRQLSDVAQTLIGMGVPANQLIPVLGRLGDVAAGDAGRLKRLALAFGEVAAEGRLTGMRLRQLASVGIGAEDLAKTMGKSVFEFRELLHVGQVGPDVLAATINRLTSATGRFADLSGRSMQTVQGQWTNLIEYVETLGGRLGETLFKRFNIAGVLQGVSDAISENLPKAFSSIMAFADRLMVVLKELGIVLISVGKAASATFSSSLTVSMKEVKDTVRGMIDAFINFGEIATRVILSIAHIMMDQLVMRGQAFATGLAVLKSGMTPEEFGRNAAMVTEAQDAGRALTPAAAKFAAENATGIALLRLSENLNKLKEGLDAADVKTAEFFRNLRINVNNLRRAEDVGRGPFVGVPPRRGPGVPEIPVIPPISPETQKFVADIKEQIKTKGTGKWDDMTAAKRVFAMIKEAELGKLGVKPIMTKQEADFAWAHQLTELRKGFEATLGKPADVEGKLPRTLEEALKRGLTPLDVFTRDMKEITKALSFGIISRPEEMLKRFKSYQDIKKAVEGGVTFEQKFPTTMMKGSAEAQDFINKAQMAITDKETEVRETLKEANRQREEFIKDVKETNAILDKILAEQGKAVDLPR